MGKDFFHGVHRFPESISGSVTMTRGSFFIGGQWVGNGRSARLPSVRITTDQFEAYRRAAKAAGVGFGEWVRRVLDKAARKP